MEEKLCCVCMVGSSQCYFEFLNSNQTLDADLYSQQL